MNIFKIFVFIFVLNFLSTLDVLGFKGLEAAIYNSYMSQGHGRWSSLKLSLGDDVFYRAVNSTDYSDFVFSVDFPGESCSPHVEGHFSQSTSAETTEYIRVAPAFFRVDRYPVHEALVEYSTVRGDKTVYFEFALADMARLENEMKQGNVLRLKLEPIYGPGDDVFVELSLVGSRAALDRAYALCINNQSNPQDFFQEEVTPSEAEEYF
jgi:hypothetical protein